MDPPSGVYIIAKHRKNAHRSDRDRAVAAVAAALAPRDGPTGEFLLHHEVATYSPKTGGKRVVSKLESMLRSDDILPEEADAGRRFRDDYMMGYLGEGRSCLNMSGGGGVGGSISDARHDAAWRYAQAQIFLDGEVHRNAALTPSQIVRMCLVEDLSFVEIGVRVNMDNRKVRSFLCNCLKVLSSYYAKVDHLRGRSETPVRRDAAMKRLQPAELD